MARKKPMQPDSESTSAKNTIEEDRDWHRYSMQFWGEVWSPRGRTVEEKAAELAQAYDAPKRPPANVLRKLTLDLVCASFPPGCPPPDEVVLLLTRALGLPKNHQVGGWPVIAGHKDDRGGVDHEARTTAMLLDYEHRLEHGENMPARQLARLVTKKLGRRCDHSSILRWRKERDYWAEYSDELPAGYLPHEKK